MHAQSGHGAVDKSVWQPRHTHWERISEGSKRHQGSHRHTSSKGCTRELPLRLEVQRRAAQTADTASQPPRVVKGHELEPPPRGCGYFYEIWRGLKEHLTAHIVARFAHTLFAALLHTLRSQCCVCVVGGCLAAARHFARNRAVFRAKWLNVTVFELAIAAHARTQRGACWQRDTSIDLDINIILLVGISSINIQPQNLPSYYMSKQTSVHVKTD